MEDQISNEMLNNFNENYNTNTLNISIPLSFAFDSVNLNWNDISFAIHNRYFAYNDAIEFAINQIENNIESNKEVLELACLLKSDPYQEQIITKYISNLSEKCSDKSKKETTDKILYLLLKWLFVNKNKYEDPYHLITIIYDDFNFPQDIVSLVKYMPQEENNITNLETSWISFLDKQKEKFGKR